MVPRLFFIVVKKIEQSKQIYFVLAAQLIDAVFKVLLPPALKLRVELAVKVFLLLNGRGSLQYYITHNRTLCYIRVRVL